MISLYLPFAKNIISKEFFNDFSTSSSYLSKLLDIYIISYPLFLKLFTISLVAWTDEYTSIPGIVRIPRLTASSSPSPNPSLKEIFVLCSASSFPINNVVEESTKILLLTLSIFFRVELSTISILSILFPKRLILNIFFILKGQTTITSPKTEYSPTSHTLSTLQYPKSSRIFISNFSPTPISFMFSSLSFSGVVESQTTSLRIKPSNSAENSKYSLSIPVTDFLSRIRDLSPLHFETNFSLILSI